MKKHSVMVSFWAAHFNFRPMSVLAKQLDKSRCHLVWR